MFTNELTISNNSISHPLRFSALAIHPAAVGLAIKTAPEPGFVGKIKVKLKDTVIPG